MMQVAPIVLVVVVAGIGPVQADEDQDQAVVQFVLHPIGRVEKRDDRTFIVLDKKYEPGLLGLDGFSHVHVMYWFDRNDTPERRAVLQVHPRGKKENPLMGVFATRSPARPNLIALTPCKIVSVQKNVIEVERIDALDNTPVLDLKPYFPGYDSIDATVPDWVNDTPIDAGEVLLTARSRSK